MRTANAIGKKSIKLNKLDDKTINIMRYREQFLSVVKYANDSKVHIMCINVRDKVLKIARFDKPEEAVTVPFHSSTSALEFPFWAKKAIDELLTERKSPFEFLELMHQPLAN